MDVGNGNTGQGPTCHNTAGILQKRTAIRFVLHGRNLLG